METAFEYPLVADRNFVLATRDSGYTTSSAVSELVDNSLQAGADHIHVSVVRYPRSQEPRVAVAVVDDGSGMAPELLRRSLQFGGSDRFGDRSGLGRYGMGLPNASLSQCRSVQVFSWLAPRASYVAELSLESIVSGEVDQLEEPRPGEPPSWLEVPDSSTGTVVLWMQCDRLGSRRPSTIARELKRSLARTFRYFLWGGTVITVNGEVLAGVDPLLLDPGSPVTGAREWAEPLTYRFPAHASGQESTVTVRFAELPVREWHDLPARTKRRIGITGGAGISVIRAGREIDYGWYFFGSKRREPYDSWWRAELTFEPELDEYFGVTHTKQHIVPTRELEGSLSKDLEAAARELNRRVRRAFAELRSWSDTEAARAATKRDALIPPLLAGQAGNGDSGRGALQRELGVRYRIDVQPLQSPLFFEWECDGGELVLVVNSNHPFYTDIYGPCRSGVLTRTQLELVLLAAARAEAQADTKLSSASCASMRRNWSNALAAFLT